MKKGLSVIICCHNSERRLPETIRHLGAQKISGKIPWEIIVVDNNSTDKTVAVAESLWKEIRKSNINLRIVTQKTPGLIFARHKGVKAAKYEYVLFCDDDNWLANNYLSVAYATISRNERMGALGGIGYPVFEGQASPPGWFEQIRTAYALGPQASKTGKVPEHCHLYGAGMVTLRKLYLDSYPANFPSLLTGRVGKSLLSGEDTEYCHRLRLQNYDIHYDSNLVFKHFIPQDRLTIEYKARLLAGTEDAQRELRRFTLLYSIVSSKRTERLSLVLKVAAGFLSAKLFGRRSWSYIDVIRSIFFLTGIDFGVDNDSKNIYQYYKTVS